MKKLLIFLLFLWATTSQAQTMIYHPFPDSNAQWNIYFWLYGWPEPYEEHYSIEILGDTIINSQLYHKLFTPYIQTSGKSKNVGITTGYNGAIRQDTLNRKVYIIPPAEVTELLLYDFTLQVGDTVEGFIEPDGDQKDVVISIDSILIGNNYRKKWNINLSYQISLIEGVGSTYGLIEQSPVEIIDAPDINITCFRQNGVTCYPDTLTNCELITSIPPITNEIDLVKVYPNPSNGSFHIEFDKSLIVKKVQITDLIGKIVYQKERNIPSRLSIEHLPKGIYILTIEDQEDKITNKKILSCP